MKYLLLPALALRLAVAQAQIAKLAPLPCRVEVPCGNVVLEPEQARVIERSLTRYEKLKKAYAEKAAAGAAKDKALVSQRRVITAKDSIIAIDDRLIWQQTSLRLMADARLQKSQGRARRRTVWIVVLALVAGIMTVK